MKFRLSFLKIKNSSLTLFIFIVSFDHFLLFVDHEFFLVMVYLHASSDLVTIVVLHGHVQLLLDFFIQDFLSFSKVSLLPLLDLLDQLSYLIRSDISSGNYGENLDESVSLVNSDFDELVTVSI